MRKSIAKIVIKGVIEKENETYSQEWILKTLRKIQKKKSVTGVILSIDSPGGGVYESDEVFEAVWKLKLDSGKTVYAYFESLAASGGYYIGCSADKIIANINTITGSIGVISGRFVDLTSFMDNHGIKSETIHSGRNKTMGSITEPITDEQRRIMQGISDECYDRFVSIVAKNRNLDIQDVIKLADGRIYTASQAKELGLIDEIFPFSDIDETIAKSMFGAKGAKMKIIEYKNKSTKGLLKRLMQGKTSTNPLNMLDSLETKVPFPAYFYDPKRIGR